MENIIKKSLRDISWQVTEEEYRSDPSYSYSTIAKFDREGFEKIDTLSDVLVYTDGTEKNIIVKTVTDSEEEV